MGKAYFPEDFPTLKSKNDLKQKCFVKTSWLQNGTEVSVRSLADCLNPWLPKPNPEVWVLHCSLLPSQTPWCSCSRGEAWKSQDLTNRPVWTDSLSWESPSKFRARQFECLMVLHDFCNRLRRCGSQEQQFRENKTRFSFCWKTLKIVISFWMKCRGWGFSKKKNHMEWEF